MFRFFFQLNLLFTSLEYSNYGHQITDNKIYSAWQFVVHLQRHSLIGALQIHSLHCTLYTYTPRLQSYWLRFGFYPFGVCLSYIYNTYRYTSHTLYSRLSSNSRGDSINFLSSSCQLTVSIELKVDVFIYM